MARPVSKDDQSRLTQVLKILGNDRRLQIVSLLNDGRERSVGEIEQEIGDLSQSALSQHLSRLRAARILTTRRESQTIYYSLLDPDVIQLLRLLTHIYPDDPVLDITMH